MAFIEALTNRLISMSQIVSVELFTFLGALIEEIIAPIPSPVIMTAAGSIAGSQNKAVIYLFWLAVLGAFGKLLGALLIYVISDKAEDFIIGKFGKFLGVSQKDIENVSKHFGKGKDAILVFFMRLIPIVPTSPVSFVAGVIKLNLKSYLVASFFGYVGRNLIYLYVGYVGIESYRHIVEGFDSVESVLQIVIAGLLIVVVGWMYYKRGKSDILSSLKKFVSRG